MQRVLLLLIALLLGAVLAGCGADAASEKTDLAKSTTTVKAEDVKVDATTTTQKKELEEVGLAKGFPKEFPVIDGMIVYSESAEISSGMDGSKQGEGYTTLIMTDKTPQEAMEFFKSKSSKHIEETPYDGTTGMYKGIIAGYTTTLYVGKREDKTKVNFTIGKSAQ